MLSILTLVITYYALVSCGYNTLLAVVHLIYLWYDRTSTPRARTPAHYFVYRCTTYLLGNASTTASFFVLKNWGRKEILPVKRTKLFCGQLLDLVVDGSERGARDTSVRLLIVGELSKSMHLRKIRILCSTCRRSRGAREWSTFG